MFFNLVRRNSKRNRRENGLFFFSLLAAIVAFYIILSLPNQDIMGFLREMESGAVDRLLSLIPAFYAVTLFILFFLIYFASRYQLERRSHELGMYLMMGMRRTKLFTMLLAEDLWSSLVSIVVGIPVAILLSEVISLVTARAVGMGILGHQSAVSLSAIFWTIAGFVLIKLAAFLLLSGKFASKEIGALLSPTPEGAKRQRPAVLYRIALALGVLLLAAAYLLAISGEAWYSLAVMGITLAFGIAGTLLLFYGLRTVLGMLAQRQSGKSGLGVFTFRQLQENVIGQPLSLAVSSLLILAALCCFGYGASMTLYYGSNDTHTLDYTFQNSENPSELPEKLKSAGLEEYFASVFDMRIGQMRSESNDPAEAIHMDEMLELIEQQADSSARSDLLNAYSNIDNPYVISLSGYNQLLAAAGEPPITLNNNQAALYGYDSFTNREKAELINHVLSQEPEIVANGERLQLTGTIQTRNPVTDRAITLYFALIVPDETFDRLAEERYTHYWDATLSPGFVQENGRMQAIQQINHKLDATDIHYESYLQSMGRQLFYQVASSYLTLYLAVIFLIIANTVIGMQFLTQQRKTGRRYRTLVRLGSHYEAICLSANRQIRWFFALPIVVAAVGSVFGVRALFSGFLPPDLAENIHGLYRIAFVILFLLCVVEYGYMLVVTRASSKYILTRMEAGREE
ncbi:putative ABC transport system permease protein [Muricomes intestini]|uniref:Putative ABC transport system permease protein n=2 Tax=Muricomes intestini TaxID=1796634 RepID=A0A4V2UST7_9FIRM|nr:ABC transporter permease [Muricomes intestini]TCS82698.1 putative ABC transport system permease protein [Muricomes intestini]